MEELNRTSGQKAAGAEETTESTQESLVAITQITGVIARQMDGARIAQTGIARVQQAMSEASVINSMTARFMKCC